VSRLELYIYQETRHRLRCGSTQLAFQLIFVEGTIGSGSYRNDEQGALADKSLWALLLPAESVAELGPLDELPEIYACGRNDSHASESLVATSAVPCLPASPRTSEIALKSSP
jgi:hypothetical protein